MGLNMYDMDMRQYDPATGRWVVQDPVVHHNMSPYNAFDNNPVFWADPSGADSQSGSTDAFGRNRFDSWGSYIPMFERQSETQEDFFNKVSIGALKETAKLYMDNKELSNLSEGEKQGIFRDDALGTIGILLWEFATGTGKEKRKFEVGVHDFANKLFEGRILEEIVSDFNTAAKKDNYDFLSQKDSKIYQIALEFSPNKSYSSWVDSLNKHINSNATQFFVGGAIAKVQIKNNNLKIQIYNETSRRSLMLHIAENYDRKNGNVPLSTIKQYISASIQIKK